MSFIRTPGRRAPKIVFRHRAVAALALAAVCCKPAAAALSAGSRSSKTADRRTRAAEITPWEAAERSRDTFEATAEATRTRTEYARVTDRFRRIYHDNPADPHAPEAVNAVAELLAEVGHSLHDRKSFQAAIGQYEFLRTQYPGSSMRVGALLAEGQIDENDLRDPAAARDRYQLLLQTYPRSALAEQARAGIASLAMPGHQPARAALAAGRQTASPAAVAQDGRLPFSSPPPGSGPTVQPLTQSPAPVVRSRPAAAPPTWGNAAQAEAVASGNRTSTLPPPREVVHRSGPLASVSGIRHWSTPSYTRVAIDLGNQVEYEAARVPSPDRIFFDLHGARLAPDLVGKSFAVTDDGFLKRIRAAQSAPDITRVVLDVNDVTEYSAFLLPNPYRLIIDIHGRKEPSHPEQLASADAPAAHAATVPNTRAMRAGSSTDVNALSDQPGKVDATSTPTSQPIAETVSGRDRLSESTLPAMRPTGVPSRPSSQPEGSASTRGLTTPTSGVPIPLNPSRGNTGASRPATSPDARVVGDPNPATTARVVAGGRHRGKSRNPAAVDAGAGGAGEPALPARAASKTADGETSLVRALGLKINRIVIDAGHGGHDSGTLGVDGLEEKDVVLDVALRLGKLLKEHLGADVIYTRSDDTFIPLETRTAIANKAQADLFLSIHANSSPDASARGVETYYLNFTQQADALEVAARENAVSGQSIHQLSDLVRKITLKDKIAESREFATDVEASLYSGLARGSDGSRAGSTFKDRGVKKAPFVVLIGANMPSILAEISFVTNPRDAAQLREPDYKQRVAESLYRGVSRYVSSLSGTAPVAPVTERAAAGQE